MLGDFEPWFTIGHVLETNGWWVVPNWMIIVKQCNLKNIILRKLSANAY